MSAGIVIERRPCILTSALQPYTIHHTPYALDLINSNNIAIHFFDDVEFFVLEVLQRQRLACKNRLYVEIIENFEFPFARTSVQFTFVGFE